MKRIISFLLTGIFLLSLAFIVVGAESPIINVEKEGLAEGSYDSIITDTITAADGSQVSLVYVLNLGAVDGLQIMNMTTGRLKASAYFFLKNDPPGTWPAGQDLLTIGDGNRLEDDLATNERDLMSAGFSKGSFAAGCSAYYFLGIKSTNSYGVLIQVGAPEPVEKATITIGDVKGSGGETVLVPFNISNNPGFAGMEATIAYDHEALTLTDLAQTAGTGLSMTAHVEEDFVMFDAADNYTEDGPLINVTFAVKEDAPAGEYPIGMTVEAADEAGEDVEFTVVSGTVTVKASGETPVTEGYTAAVGSDHSKNIGDTAVVNVTVGNGDENVKSFNAFDMTFIYDKDRLKVVSESSEGFTVTDDKAGTVRVHGYGADRAVGTGIDLAFTCLASGDAEVKLTKAFVDVSAHAIGADAPEATVTADTVTISIGSDLAVTLDDKFEGETSVAPGGTYTFTAKDPHYDYTFTATMGNDPVTVTGPDAEGKYTVENVTGLLVITATGTPKTYTVTVTGSAKDDVTWENSATYLTNYSFTINVNEGYNYQQPVITIGGTAYDGYYTTGWTYNIPGADVTGDIAIAVEKTAVQPQTYQVTFDGEGAGDAAGASTATHGTAYSFTLTEKEGYDYIVTVKVNGLEVEVTGENGTYTIPAEKVTGPITISVTKTAHLEVKVYEYVKLDNKTIYLVVVSGPLDEGKTFTYDSNVMYAVEDYGGYAWLTVETAELTQEAATAKVAIAAATSTVVAVDGDVNGTGTKDVNDAQLTYDIYNAKYDSFEQVSMQKFLQADVNKDHKVDTGDAAAVISIILQ